MPNTQWMVPIVGGTATFTNSDSQPDDTKVELKLSSFSWQTFALTGLQFSHGMNTSDLFGTATLCGGATVVGNVGPGPCYKFGEFDISADPTTHIGSVTADAFDPPLIGSHLPPDRVVNGVPYWGAPGADRPGYFDVSGPDQYIAVTLYIPRAVPAATGATPQLPVASEQLSKR